MGNSSSAIRQHLYVLKVTNMDLPLCPFIHTIIGFNGTPILDTDPRIFHDILTREDLVFDVIDIRDNAVFTVCMPKGTAKLGINVIKLTANITPLNMRITNVREGSPFLMGDQILGIENIYLPDENQLVAHIKSRVNNREVFIIMREEHVIAEEIEVKDDMGCEIGMGILYRPHTRECYMEGYNGRITRIFENGANRQSQEEIQEGSHAKAASGARVEVLRGGDHGSSAGNAARSDNCIHVPPDNIAHGSLQAAAESGKQVWAGRSPDSAITCNGVEDHLSQLDITGRGSQAKHPVGDANVQDGIRPPSTSNDVAPSNRVCNEAGQAHEAEYFRGERKPVSEGAVIINDTLVDRNDFIRDDGHLRMKSDAFERRREAFPAGTTASQHVEEERGVSLDGASLKAGANDSKEEVTNEKNQASIFENDSDDAELPFEKGGPKERLDGPEMDINGKSSSAKMYDGAHSHLSPLDHDYGSTGSLPSEDGPASSHLSSGISAIMNDDSDVAYDEWDRITHVKSEPAPADSRISPSAYDGGSMLPISERHGIDTSATVLPVVFDDVPSGVYPGNDPRAASNPVLESMDSLERSSDPREPASDTEVLL